MSTTQIGTEYENKVAKFFGGLLDGEGLGYASSKYSKIFQHKKYQGKIRKYDCDITIETYNPSTNSDNWDSIIVIECKCLKDRKLDIGDFDEFRSKLRDISEHAVKGIMVTTVGFTPKEIEQAKDLHIGLMVLSESKHQWIVGRDINTKPELIMPILLGEKQVNYQPIAYYDGTFTSIIDLLQNFNVAVTDKNEFKIPFLSDEVLRDKATALYKSYDFETNEIAEEILKVQYPNIQIGFEDMPEGQLGSLSFIDNAITISRAIKNDVHRKNFTIAHELGHLILHAEILKQHLERYDDYDKASMSLLPAKALKRMEVQANKFASYFLIPHFLLQNELRALFKQFSITRGYLYLDKQKCNLREVNYILGTLSRKFNVSKEVIRYRLEDDGRLKIGDDVPKRLCDFF